MAETSESQCDGQEFVTDWRMVYSAVGVCAVMIAGATVWSLFVPANATPIATPVARADNVASEMLPVVTPVEAETVEVVVPWAPLPAEQRLPPEPTRLLPPPDPIAVLDKNPAADERTVPALNDDAGRETHEDLSLKESSRADEFIAELRHAVTLDFNPVNAAQTPTRGLTRSVTLRPSTQLTQEQQFELLANRSDLVGLPILGEDQCHKSPEEVKELARVSRGMALIDRNRRVQQTGYFSLSQEYGIEQELLRFIADSKLNETSVAPLVQILQVHEVGVRMMLVDALSSIEGPEASQALADRALFDLSRGVREAAIESLQCRDYAECQPRLLEALRYPLAAVAFRAAETLVALGETEVLPRLEQLLDEPDPSEPFTSDDGTLQKTELVRVNHLRNCLLCHPHSGSRKDLVRGAVPTPGLPLPQRYYHTSSRAAVSADVTYLRQDFSVMQRVDDRGRWPEMQRFDFLVRTRPLTDEEQKAKADSLAAEAKESSSYPQREAVLFAIKGLSEPSS